MSLRDRKTTPKALRPFGLLLLLLFAVPYLAQTWRYATGERVPVIGRLPIVRMLGSWSMFSKASKNHSTVEAEAWRGDKWLPVDLDSLFEARWDSGRRFDRPQFYKPGSPYQMALANAICTRLGKAHPEGIEPKAVRIHRIKWPRRPGQMEQPRTPAKKVKVTTSPAWDCRRDPPTFEGWSL